ncbi:MAG: folylpolyglutamate synthase/dihydrofolate synthase family protein [Methanomassiliicoccus sp.]|nr:folylpolyglutamate synthase/dihydrofolate synthase family protein [Methanomassiliicoccus sp.]
MDYGEALSWLYGRETMGIKFGLDNISRLLSKLGDPHHRFRSVHVAGSNGKGSVSAMTAAVLQESGYITGLYTSPHLVDFRERMSVDGRCIPEAQLLRLIEEVRGIAESTSSPEQRLTFFELATGIAFAYFADLGVEEAVVEVGMGGRLDATNVIVPDCCAITRIGLEHTKYLGTTVEAIAGEKAGIIKPGVPVVTIDQEEGVLDVFRRTAVERKSSLKVIGRDVGFETLSSTLEGTEVWVEEIDAAVRVPLIGRYQAGNCAVACGVVTELMKRGVYVPDEAFVNGLAKVKWPGRMEMVSASPPMMFDVTHTPDGAREVASEVRRLVGEGIVLVMGVLDDKDLQGIAANFGPLARVAVATSPDTPRALPSAAVAGALRRYCPSVEEVTAVPAALDRAVALAAPGETVLVTGSLYTIGEAYGWLNGRQTDQ